MSIAGMAPGWLIGYLTADDGEWYTYKLLPVVSLAARAGSEELDAIVMEPGGKPMRADDIPGRVFAVGPTEDVRKVALIHAKNDGRKARLPAKAAAAA